MKIQYLSGAQLPGSPDHELIAIARDETIGFEAIIAIHNTSLGPAVGGTRYWPYDSLDDAITDACRLSRGMTYKSALAGLPFGGGKSVIRRAANGADRQTIFRAHGRFIAELGGRYITAEDVGTTPDDMAIIREETPHVAGLPDALGDPGPYTARGVFQAIRAGVAAHFGTPDLKGRVVAIQGCGAVGSNLAKQLHTAGAQLILADVDAERVRALARTLDARVLEPDAIYAAEADVFAPCALGGVLSHDTARMIRAAIIAGGANNQLTERIVASVLAERGILYVPDYAANAGGVITGSFEILGGDVATVETRIDRIFDTVTEVLTRARAAGTLPVDEADAIVEAKLRA